MNEICVVRHTEYYHTDKFCNSCVWYIVFSNLRGETWRKTGGSASPLVVLDWEWSRHWCGTTCWLRHLARNTCFWFFFKHESYYDSFTELKSWWHIKHWHKYLFAAISGSNLLPINYYSTQSFLYMILIENLYIVIHRFTYEIQGYTTFFTSDGQSRAWISFVTLIHKGGLLVSAS